MKCLFTMLLVVLVVLVQGVTAQAALNAGDIAIIAFNLAPDDFRCVTMVDLPQGEVIKFTDNGWTNDQFRTGEGITTWTNPSLMAAGTIFDAIGSAMTLAAAGDQILAYQAAEGSTTFVYAVNCQGTDGVWQASATNSNSSGLPTGLTNGECAVALPNTSSGNWVFNTNIFASGTRTEWLVAIGEKTNWLASTNMPAGSITITGGSSLPDNPQSFSATVISTSQVDLAWTKNASNDDVVVAYATNSTFGSPSGSYLVGDPIAGGGEVIYNGSGTSYSHLGLIPGKAYFYKAWSLHTGPLYSAGVTASATTPDPNYPGITITNPAPPAVRYMNGTSSVDIQGFSSNLVGDISWTNSGTASAGAVAAANEWAITSLAIGQGANAITITASNSVGQIVSASITIARASPTVLNPGDLQIIGYRSDADDGLALVTWVNLSEGLQINMTDCGWSNTQLRLGENFASWTVPSGGLPAGTVAVFTFTNGTDAVVDIGTATGNLDGLSTSGDQVLLYTGPQDAPTFVYAIDFSGANTNWDSSATSTTSSGLPPELATYGNNMAVRFIDNYQYTNSRSDTLSALKASVLETNNWIGSVDGIGFVLDSTDFTIGGGGGPVDTDADGMSDDYEMTYFTNATAGVAGNDDDGDGFSNLEEYLADTIPNGAAGSNSLFEIQTFTNSTPQSFVFPSSTGRVYTLQTSSDLLLGDSWSNLQTDVQGDGGPMTLTDPVQTGGRDYRLRVRVP